MSDERDRDGETLTARRGGVRNLMRRRPPGKHRALTTKGLPALLMIGGAVPVFMGLTGSHSTAQHPASAVLCTGYSGCASSGYTGHGYGQHSSTSYWRMAAGNECTNYVAYVESTVFRAPEPDYLLGNGGQWAASAKAHGVVVNHTPAVGAVAVWYGGTTGMGPMGHVAVVEQVGPRDRYIVISQQNISSEADNYDWTKINAGHPASQWQEWPSTFVHFPIARRAAVGYFNSARHLFRLRDSLSAGPANFAFAFGRRRVTPLTGNWTGGRTEGVGYYNPKNATFYLRDSLSAGKPSYVITFGPRHMIPLAGNWDGGLKDGIGFYNPRDGWFHLRDSLSRGNASYQFKLGPGHMVPVVGDWVGA